MAARRTARRPLALSERLDAFDDALALGEGRVDPPALAAARAVRSRVDERLARGEGLVVTAFAGGTGTGKSSLFNAVAGEQIAETGARRPTTEEPQALVVGELQPAVPLLDWLGVRRRHVTDADGLPDGLVLLDLPDHDSVARHHRRASEQLVQRVDLIVWTVDPLKYSRRDLHHEALRPLAEHAAVLVVVMNHADALSSEDRRSCAADLRRLLDAEGLDGARLLTTSARTGEGLAELRALVSEEARRRRAVTERVAADLRAAAKALAPGGGEAPDPAAVDLTGLVAALASAAGVGGRADAAAAEYRRAALAGSRPVSSRLVTALWGLLVRLATSARALLERPAAARADRPEGAAPAAVQHALLELVDSVADHLPAAARQRVREAAGADATTLGRAVGRAVDAVPLRPPRRRWWAPLAVGLSLLDAAVLVGVGWLVLAGLVDWLRLPPLPLPTLAGAVPWPSALLLGGLAARLLGGIARRRAVHAGAARHAAEVRERLHRRVERAADEHVGAPVRAELERLRRLEAALARAAG